MKSHDDEFTPLEAFQGEFPSARSTSANVIKSALVSISAHRTVGTVEGSGEGEITVHRDGDRIEKISFTCLCGRCSSVVFEYE
ncbi:MAG TPA: hypothetical protein VEO56_03095 [Bacteroidota bacterium]|nr:hypothetical protein [Bacteroidota bacterium]